MNIESFLQAPTPEQQIQSFADEVIAWEINPSTTAKSSGVTAGVQAEKADTVLFSSSPCKL